VIDESFKKSRVYRYINVAISTALWLAFVAVLGVIVHISVEFFTLGWNLVS